MKTKVKDSPRPSLLDPQSIRVYSDVVNNGLILPRKAKYTVRDCVSVMINSLFYGLGTFTHKQASFIVKCSAAYHGTEYSKRVSTFGDSIIF